MDRRDEQTLDGSLPADYDADERKYARILLERLEDPLPDWGWDRWDVLVTLEYHYCDNDARGIRWMARNTFTPSDEFDQARFSGTQHTYRWRLVTPMCSPAEAGRLVGHVVAALPRTSTFSPDAPDYSVWVEPHEWAAPADEPDTLDTLPLGKRRHTRAGDVFGFPRRRRPLTSSEMLDRLEHEGVEAFMAKWGPAIEPLSWKSLAIGSAGLLIPADNNPDWSRLIPDDYRTRVVEFAGGIDETCGVQVYPFNEDAVIINGDRVIAGKWADSRPLKERLLAQWRRETVEPKIAELPLRVRIGEADVPCWDPRHGGILHSTHNGYGSGSERYDLYVTLGHGCPRCDGTTFTVSYLLERRRTGYARFEDSHRFTAECRGCGAAYEAFERSDHEAREEGKTKETSPSVDGGAGGSGADPTDEHPLTKLYRKAMGNSIFLLLEHWESLPDDELTDAQREAVEEVRRSRAGAVQQRKEES